VDLPIHTWIMEINLDGHDGACVCVLHLQQQMCAFATANVCIMCKHVCSCGVDLLDSLPDTLWRKVLDLLKQMIADRGVKCLSREFNRLPCTVMRSYGVVVCM
jgi:uncharacterized Fe-S cluster-containing MiaB family protein